MCIRNSFVLALVAASAGLLGCREDQAVARPAGGIELVVRSPSDSRALGTFTVRHTEQNRTWRVPVRAEGYQKRRLLLEPGLYSLNFEPDMSAALAAPGPPAATASPATSLDMPRLIVVAPARVTTIDVTAGPTPVAPCVAGAPPGFPPGSLQLN